MFVTGYWAAPKQREESYVTTSGSLLEHSATLPLTDAGAAPGPSLSALGDSIEQHGVDTCTNMLTFIGQPPSNSSHTRGLAYAGFGSMPLLGTTALPRPLSLLLHVVCAVLGGGGPDTRLLLVSQHWDRLEGGGVEGRVKEDGQTAHETAQENSSGACILWYRLCAHLNALWPRGELRESQTGQGK